MEKKILLYILRVTHNIPFAYTLGVIVALIPHDTEGVVITMTIIGVIAGYLIGDIIFTVDNETVS